MADMERDDEANFARRMVELRKRLEMSQSELARRMVERGFESYSQTSVSRTEKGERPIRLGEARVIAEILGTSVDRMARGTDVEELLDLANKVNHTAIEAILDVARATFSYAHVLEMLKETRSRLERFDNPETIAEADSLRTMEFPTAIVAAWAAEVAVDPMRDMPEVLPWTDLMRMSELAGASSGVDQTEA